MNRKRYITALSASEKTALEQVVKRGDCASGEAAGTNRFVELSRQGYAPLTGMIKDRPGYVEQLVYPLANFGYSWLER